MLKLISEESQATWHKVDRGALLKPTLIQVIVLLCLGIAVALVSLQDFGAYQLGTHIDDSGYVVLARSLLYSDHYGMMNLPGEPGVAKYPFGYPLFLASILAVHDNLDALKWISLIATLLNMSLLFWGWRWLSKSRSYWWAVAIAGMYGLSPMTMGHTRRIMSEPVFLTFSLITIILAERAAYGKLNILSRVALGVSLVFTVYTRTIGLVLVALALAYVVFFRRGKAWSELAVVLTSSAMLLILIVAATPVRLRDLLPLEYLKDTNARIVTMPFTSTGSSDTITPSQGAKPPAAKAYEMPVSRVIYNLLRYGIEQHFGSDIRAVAFPLGGGDREKQLGKAIGLPALPSISGLLVGVLVSLGFFRLLATERFSLFLCFAGVYFLVLLLWVWDDPRLLYPVQPQIHWSSLAVFESGMVWLAAHVKKAKLRIPILNSTPSIPLVALVLLLLASFSFKSAQIHDSRINAGDLNIRSNWLLANVRESAVVMSEAPEVDYIYTGKKTVPYPSDMSSAKTVDDYLAGYQVQFILVAPQIKWYPNYKPQYSKSTLSILVLLDELESKGRISLIYSLEKAMVKVYRVEPSRRSFETALF